MLLTKKSFYAAIAAGTLFMSGCGEKPAEPEAASVEAPAKKKAPVFPSAPDAAIKMIADEVSKGNLGVLWQAMPATYRSDVNEYVALASEKLDAEIYDQTFAFLGKLADVANKQKEFIFNTQLGGEKPAEEKAQLEAALPSLVEIVKGISTSEIATLEGLKTFDGQKFFDTTVSQLAGQMDALTQLSDETEFNLSDLSKVVIEIVESNEGLASLKMTSPDGESETQSFTKVEERWVPTDMAEGWVQGFAEAKAQLEALSVEEMAANKPQFLSVFAMLDGVLTQIDSAQTQEQFDQALQGAMMPIMGLMMMGGSMGAPVQ